jgi:hypothetical protein
MAVADTTGTLGDGMLDLVTGEIIDQKELREALGGAKYRSAMERIRERLGSFTGAFNDLAVGALSAARSDVFEPEWRDRIDH